MTRRLVLLAVALIAALGGGAYYLTRRPVMRIRALIDDGRRAEAAAAIDAYRRAHPARGDDVFFLEGYLAHDREHRVEAARLYKSALQAPKSTYRRDRTIFRQMTGALSDDDCAVRVAAAGTLTVLGERRAVDALRGAIEEEDTRNRGIVGMVKSLICQFPTAAHEAIRQLSSLPPG